MNSNLGAVLDKEYADNGCKKVTFDVMKSVLSDIENKIQDIVMSIISKNVIDITKIGMVYKLLGYKDIPEDVKELEEYKTLVLLHKQRYDTIFSTAMNDDLSMGYRREYPQWEDGLSPCADQWFSSALKKCLPSDLCLDTEVVVLSGYYCEKVNGEQVFLRITHGGFVALGSDSIKRIIIQKINQELPDV